MYQPKTISMKELSDSGDYFVYGANGIIGRYTNYNHENSEVVIACRGATCGAVNVTLPKSWINGNAMVVKPHNDLVCHDYLVAFLKVFNWKKVISGSAQPQITRKNLATVLFPLPPLEEQHRIVAKLNQLCDQIESAENAYKELSGSLSERFKQLCLEKVVQGKLVPQLESEPEVEPFSDEPDAPPFDIPDKWKWAKFKDVVDVRDGTHDTPKYQISGIPLVTSKNLRNGSIDFTNVKYISKEDHKEISKRSKVEKGDILFAMIGTVGNPAIVENEGIFSIKNVALFKPLCNSNLNFQYLYYVLLFMQDQMLKESSGGVQRFVSLKYLRNFYIPIPPLDEQQRIVLRISELLSVIKIL